MKLSLIVLTSGKQEGKLLPIPLAQFVIGRDPQCHLRPASPAISKRHCALIQRDGKVFVRDFDSTNGTFVNDVPVKGEVELHHEDILKVGPLLFGVKVETSPPVNRPTPSPPTKAPTQARPPIQAAAPTPAQAKPAPAPAAAQAKPAPAPAAAQAKPAPAAAQPPAPAAAPAAKKDQARTALGAGASDDDSIAAMLLSLQDDSEGGSGLAGEIPEGSTVMDIGIVPQAEGGQGEKKEEDKAKTPPPPPQTTANAAKALLEKYMKRPR